MRRKLIATTALIPLLAPAIALTQEVEPSQVPSIIGSMEKIVVAVAPADGMYKLPITLEEVPMSSGFSYTQYTRRFVPAAPVMVDGKIITELRVVTGPRGNPYLPVKDGSQLTVFINKNSAATDEEVFNLPEYKQLSKAALDILREVNTSSANYYAHSAQYALATNSQTRFNFNIQEFNKLMRDVSVLKRCLSDLAAERPVRAECISIGEQQ